MPLLIIYFTVIALLFFLIGSFFPVFISTFVFAATFVVVLKKYKSEKVGALFFLLYVAYLLPFIHIPPYIIFDYSSTPIILWGLAVRPYMVEEEVIKLTAMIGAVGALGLTSSALIENKKIHFNEKYCNNNANTLSILSFVLWVALGIAISKISAPSENIFEAGYGDVESIADAVNLGSAWLVSYVMLSFVVVDALLEKKESIRILKSLIIYCMVVYVAFFLQFMRGDRAVIPWILSLLMLYIIWGKNNSRIKLSRRKKILLICTIILIMMISSLIGIFRNSLVDGNAAILINLIFEMYESGDFELSNSLHGTWSAVLLTPLSVAGDYVHGLLDFKLGVDYYNLFLSLPPGALADAIGYVRPWGSNSGPPFEMRYGQGGTHAAVLPFMNFGMIGVYVLALILGKLYIFIENFARKKNNTYNLSLLVCISLATPHFLWYGEKNGINAVLAWAFFAVIYKLLVMPYYQRVSVTKDEGVYSFDGRGFKR